uniref:Uncharacterized protein n=1 Tax=Xiphophorus maculatus TaxID=8083 RepID=A0A3B5QGG3_XIPMA
VAFIRKSFSFIPSQHRLCPTLWSLVSLSVCKSSSRHTERHFCSGKIQKNQERGNNRKKQHEEARYCNLDRSHFIFTLV